jgi:hypothetical protein
VGGQTGSFEARQQLRQLQSPDIACLPPGFYEQRKFNYIAKFIPVARLLFFSPG